MNHTIGGVINSYSVFFNFKGRKNQETRKGTFNNVYTRYDATDLFYYLKCYTRAIALDC